MKPMFPIIALTILTCAGAQAKDYHYHAPKAHDAPKVYAPHYSTVPVRGYIKSNGTYVMPHYQTAPNSTKLDNWSTKGNINPYTGKSGTKDPYAPPSSGGRG